MCPAHVLYRHPIWVITTEYLLPVHVHTENTHTQTQEAHSRNRRRNNIHADDYVYGAGRCKFRNISSVHVFSWSSVWKSSLIFTHHSGWSQLQNHQFFNGNYQPSSQSLKKPLYLIATFDWKRKTSYLDADSVSPSSTKCHICTAGNDFGFQMRELSTTHHNRSIIRGS